MTDSGSDAPAAGPATIPKMPTHMRGLDDILAGGLPRGRTTLLSGGPGTGKTVFAVELLYRGALAGEPGVFISFEEHADDVRANATAMGMDVAGLEESGKLKVLHAEVPHGAVRSGEFDIKGLLGIVEGHTRALGAKFVVLDAIDVLMRIFGDPTREREEMYLLNDWLRERGFTVVLTVKANPAGEQIYPFLDFMADCVLFLDQRMHGQVRTRRLNVRKFRGSDFLSNEHPYVLSSRGVVLMPVSSVALVHEASGKPVTTGNGDLDATLGGGYLRGSCVLVAGASGTGKTTLACTFARAACQRGEEVLYVGFEESQEAMATGMLSTCIDLAPVLEAGTLRVLTAMPESLGVERHLLDAFEALGPDHVVVDAISACHRMGSERAAFDFLLRLLTFCKEHGVTCLLADQLAEPEQAAQIAGYGISSLVDTLLVLEYCDDSRRISRRLLVVKSRGVAHSMRYHPFRITDDGIVLDAVADERAQEGARYDRHAPKGCSRRRRWRVSPDTVRRRRRGQFPRRQGEPLELLRSRIAGALRNQRSRCPGGFRPRRPAGDRGNADPADPPRGHGATRDRKPGRPGQAGIGDGPGERPP